MIKHFLAIVTILLSFFAFPYCLGHWNVSHTLDQFKMPRFPELTEENLGALEKKDLIQMALSITADDQGWREMDKDVHWHLRNSILLLAAAVVLLSLCLVWFMVSNYALRRKLKELVPRQSSSIGDVRE